MKKILSVIAVALMLGACSGIDDELGRIDAEIASLKEADESLYNELSAQITALEQSLLEKIAQTKERLGGDISAAMADLMDLVTAKMEGVQEYLDTKLLEQKKHADESIMGVRGYIQNTQRTLETLLEDTYNTLDEAIVKGDQDLVDRLKTVPDKIATIDATASRVDHYMALWKSRLDAIQGSGLYDAMDGMDALVSKLASFDLQTSISDMEYRLKLFTQIKMEELSGEEMKELKALISEMEDWVFEADGLASDAESMSSEMQDLLDDWQRTADDIYTAIDGRSEDILSQFEDIVSDLEDMYAQAEDYVDQIESTVEDIETIGEAAEEFGVKADQLLDEIEECANDVDDKIQEVYDYLVTCNEYYSELDDLCEDWKDRHPWLFE